MAVLQMDDKRYKPVSSVPNRPANPKPKSPVQPVPLPPKPKQTPKPTPITPFVQPQNAAKMTQSTPKPSQPQGVWIRDYLRKQGFTDDQIGWDNGTVTLNGSPFFTPTTVQDGKSYADANALNQALGQFRMNQTNNQIMDIINQLQQQANSPFSYNPKDDPAYQAALRQAERNAEIASRNAMETLNERGILNSTITSDRLGQIEQDAYSYVTDTVLPQLMQQAYTREQQGLNNLLNVLGALQQQQGFQYQQGRDAVADQRYAEQFAYQQLRDQIEDERWQKQFDEDVRRFGLQYALEQQVQLGNLSMRQAELAFRQSEAAADRALRERELALREQGLNNEQPESYDEAVLKAIQLAQDDPQWFMAGSEQERQQIINRYLTMLTGQTSFGGITDEEILQYTR